MAPTLILSPIGMAAVRLVEVGHVGQRMGVIGHGVFVELDAQPRPRGQRKGRAVTLQLHGEEIGRTLVDSRVDLNPGKVVDGKTEMDRRRRADRAQRVVGHDIDIVRFAPATDLVRLGQPTNVADIHAAKVG